MCFSSEAAASCSTAQWLFPWLLHADTLYIIAAILAGDVLDISLPLSRADIFLSPGAHAFLPCGSVTFTRSRVFFPFVDPITQYSFTFPSGPRDISIIGIFFLFSYGYSNKHFALVWPSCMYNDKKAEAVRKLIPMILSAENPGIAKADVAAGLPGSVGSKAKLPQPTHLLPSFHHAQTHAEMYSGAHKNQSLSKGHYMKRPVNAAAFRASLPLIVEAVLVCMGRTFQEPEASVLPPKYAKVGQRGNSEDRICPLGLCYVVQHVHTVGPTKMSLWVSQLKLFHKTVTDCK